MGELLRIACNLHVFTPSRASSSSQSIEMLTMGAPRPSLEDFNAYSVCRIPLASGSHGRREILRIQGDKNLS